MSDEKPFLSSSKVVEDYKLLIKYMEKCKSTESTCEKLLPTSQLLVQIKEIVDSRMASFEEIINLVEKTFHNEINCEICIESFKEAYGIDVDCERARKTLIVQLAGWLIEILDTLGYVKIRYSWKPRNQE